MIVIEIELRQVNDETVAVPVNDSAIGLAEIAGTAHLKPEVLRIAARHLHASILAHKPHEKEWVHQALGGRPAAA